MNKSVSPSDLSDITEYLIRLAYAPQRSKMASTDDYHNLSNRRRTLLKVAHHVELLKEQWQEDRSEEVERCCSLLAEIIDSFMSDDAVSRMRNSVRQMRLSQSDGRTAISTQYYSYKASDPHPDLF